MADSILQTLQTIEDLRALPARELPVLADEIRQFLIEKVTKTGGHLASNLGVVELTIALHRVFDTPQDRIIWDVGHQSYVHKILTGRLAAFDTLRTGDGLCGFTKRSESVFDPFGAGHSSTSLSAALGFAEADHLSGKTDNYTIAVVGDGAFTGGMIHEALNNCPPDRNLIIVLNENEMSISRTIGGFSRHIAKIRTSRGYYRLKHITSDFLKKIPLCGNALYRFVRGCKRRLKDLLYDSNYFEDMGLSYLGPCNGNDIAVVTRLLEEAKHKKRTTVIHCKTQKGKGMPAAESNPGFYHGVPREGSVPRTDKTFSATCGETLTALAHTRTDICAITAAMADGTGLVPFFEAHPARAFDVGIAESHALTFAAGLAAAGKRPFFAVYSTFLQRGYDNVLHDIALQKLPVVLCIDRAGLNVGDGATHHGIFDVAMLLQIPDVAIYAPLTPTRLVVALTAAAETETPLAIRYPNGYTNPDLAAHFFAQHEADAPLSFVADFAADAVPETVLVTYGVVTREVCKAAEAANAQGKSCGVLLLENLRPTPQDIAAMRPYLDGAERLLFVEEGIRQGGAGMYFADALTRQKIAVSTTILGIDNSFVEVIPQGDAFAAAGIDAAHILAQMGL